MGTTETLEQDIRRVPDARLWELRTTARKSLIEYACQRLARQLAASGRPAEMVEGAKHLFDPHVLTLGFARRFAIYKRPNLLLHDPERLLRLLTDPQRPVQLIVAGKAHPEDHSGQALIQEWMRFIWRSEARAHVMFLSDHDMFLAERLVQGVDVWINTPRRPWEACGTSGMKVLVNGGINFSELDGWWAEAYMSDLGWALGDGQEHDDDSGWDAAEAEMLYDRLEHEVIPEFYSRDEDGIPTAWVARMRESMARLTPIYCSSRTVREYTEQHYLPAAENYLARAADNGALGVRVVKWQHALDQKWAALRFGEVKMPAMTPVLEAAFAQDPYAFYAQLRTLGRKQPREENAVIVVIFEVWPADSSRRTQYLDIASRLRPLLDDIDGFISVERFESLTESGKVLSLSFWRDEAAVANWRNTAEHRAAQTVGRGGVFRDYRLRIAHVIRDYGLEARDEAPTDSRQRHG